jgi:hypothetical protein
VLEREEVDAKEWWKPGREVDKRSKVLAHYVTLMERAGRFMLWHLSLTSLPYHRTVSLGRSSNNPLQYPQVPLG